MAMEITIEHDKVDDTLYTTTIRPAAPNNKPTIVETLWFGNEHYSGTDHSLVNNWVSKIRRKQKGTTTTLIMSLIADHKAHYRNSGHTSNRYDCRGGKVTDIPFDILQLCVDNQCLLFKLNEPHYYSTKYCSYSKGPILSLWKLLYDNKTVVVGLGIEDVVKKLDKDYNLKISKWVDMRDKAREKGIYGEIPMNCSVVKLAKQVLGDDQWDRANKPVNMDWLNPENRGFLSDDKVKFGTLESFLAYKIGTVLLKD